VRVFDLLKLSMVRRTVVNKGTRHERALFCSSDSSTLQMNGNELEDGHEVLVQKDFLNFSVSNRIPLGIFFYALDSMYVEQIF